VLEPERLHRGVRRSYIASIEPSNRIRTMMTRRQALKTTALVATASAVMPSVLAQPAPAAATGPFTLPSLPYPFDALEPHIDARTMEIHHGRHHKAYVDNLNKAISDSPGLGLVQKSVEDLIKDLDSVPEKIRTAVRNNGGGHYNHSLFWQMMKKGGGGEPKGELAKAIEKSFGSFTAFKESFAKAGLGQFGSGWAWLVATATGTVLIESSPNQDSPTMKPAMDKDFAAFAQAQSPGKLVSTKVPLLGIDVWEHAYYLKYQNKRADYIAAWWNVVNWDFVAERYAKLRA
jgi:superoxide dismutase, Fe-Mn family